MNPPPLEEKVRKILSLILLFLAILLFRSWYLAVIKHEEKVEEIKKPQTKIVIEPAKRGAIIDRFGAPLAINKISYQAAVLYSGFQHLPSSFWEIDLTGKKVKRNLKKEAIESLSKKLADLLSLDAKRIEDMIYSKAALHPYLPLVIKEDLQEEEYFQLKAIEKDYPGLLAESKPKRFYPQGKVASDVIGYLGAISQKEYSAVLEEIQCLESYLEAIHLGDGSSLQVPYLDPEEAFERLIELRDRAYTISDLVGKTGLEAQFEESLRGFIGKKFFSSDAKGRILKELPGFKEALCGQTLKVTLSSELQAFAEALLAQNEEIRSAHLSGHPKGEKGEEVKQPWIKGGAIVAMDPHSGELLALASYPRVDLNDFIPSKKRNLQLLHRWLETDNYFGNIWDQNSYLERERFDPLLGVFYEDRKLLDWTTYLDLVLSKKSGVWKGFEVVKTLKDALDVQDKVNALLTMSGQEEIYPLFNLLFQEPPHQIHKSPIPAHLWLNLKETVEKKALQFEKLKQELLFYLKDIPHNYDKVLFIDLCALPLPKRPFCQDLLKEMGDWSLERFRSTSTSAIQVTQIVKEMAKDFFRETHFQRWRSVHQKDFLKQKRAQEAAKKTFSKPYLTLLDQEEKKQFELFWKTHQKGFVLCFLGLCHPKSEGEAHFFSWSQELSKGAHRLVPWWSVYHGLKKALLGLSEKAALAFLENTRAYQDLTLPLLGNYKGIRKSGNRQLEKDLAAAFYPAQGYSYGRSQAFRQGAMQGSIFKLVTAYAALAQEAKKGNRHFLNPLEIVDAHLKIGPHFYVGSWLDGKLIPEYYKGGRLPKSASRSIGQINLVKALECSSNPYFAILAKDVLDSPKILLKTAKAFSFGEKTGLDIPGEFSGALPHDLDYNMNNLYATAIGQGSLVVTPLQSAVMISSLVNGGRVLRPKILLDEVSSKPDIQRELFFPTAIQNTLLEGMRQSALKLYHEGASSLSHLYRHHKQAIEAWTGLKSDFLGKTSTAEMMEHIDLDLFFGTNKYTHVWFGAVSLDRSLKNRSNRPLLCLGDVKGVAELVVVVYLKYGHYGKEAAPVAAQVIQKWREIKKRD